MRASRILGILLCATGALVRCVGDDSIVPPGGDAGDATTDGTLGDSGDAAVEAGPPTPDGSLAWLQHFNTNAGFEDLAVNENGGPSFVLGGTFAVDQDAGGVLHMGTHDVQPVEAVLTSALLATTTATGPVWAVTPQEDTVYTQTPSCNAYQNYDEGSYTSVAVDATGTIYVTGTTTARYFYLKDIFPGPVSFVAAFSNAGTPLWDHLYSVDGGAVNGFVDDHSTNGYADALRTKMSLAVAGGKVFVAFGFSGTLQFEQADAGAATVSSTTQSIFVTALDAKSGATEWHETLSSAGDDLVEQVVATPQGGAVLTGTMQGTMTGVTGTDFPLVAGGDAGNAGPEAYVIKLDASGKPVYAFTYATDPTVGTSGALGVAEGTGVVAVGGYFQGAVDFGAGPVTSQGGYDGFVAVVDEATLKPKFVVPLAGAGNDAIDGVALDAWNELFAVGPYGEGTPAAASFGATLLPQTQAGVVPMFLAKTDATGKQLWSHAISPSAPDGGAADTSNGEPQSVFGTRIHTTASGQVAVTGEMSGGANFGAGYQSVLSTLHAPAYCIFIANGQNSHCQCETRVPDGFIGVWQP